MQIPVVIRPKGRPRKKRDPTPEQVAAAKERCWKAGYIQWKLKPVQIAIKKKILASPTRKPVVHCSRRLGKSYLLCTMAIESAIRNPRWPVRYVAPTRVGLRTAIHPLMQEILSDCPAEIRPKWNTLDNQYLFPNGGTIHLVGANNSHEDDARGSAAGLAIVDEAAFVDNLRYLVQDVLMPQTINTGGMVILSSSSPRSPAHEFVDFIQEAEISGNYSIHTIDSAGYSPEIVEEFKREAGGADSTTWKREYLCELVVDQDFAITPEWQRVAIDEMPRDDYFKFYHTYVAMDIGFKDYTAVIFGHYDFKRGVLFIEDELVRRGPAMTTDVLSEEIKAKESELWGDKPVYRRIADNNNPIMLNDMAARHKLAFMATSKDSLEAMVNYLRVFVNSGKLMVSEKCRNVIGCLRHGVWNQARTEFDRSASLGHFDALAALIYLVRNLDMVTNPVPSMLGLSHHTHQIPADLQERNLAEEFEILKMVGIRGQL